MVELLQAEGVQEVPAVSSSYSEAASSGDETVAESAATDFEPTPKDEKSNADHEAAVAAAQVTGKRRTTRKVRVGIG